jgi:hypothetical protein
MTPATARPSDALAVAGVLGTLLVESDVADQSDRALRYWLAGAVAALTMPADQAGSPASASAL